MKQRKNIFDLLNEAREVKERLFKIETSVDEDKVMKNNLLVELDFIIAALFNMTLDKATRNKKLYKRTKKIDVIDYSKKLIDSINEDIEDSDHV